MSETGEKGSEFQVAFSARFGILKMSERDNRNCDAVLKQERRNKE